MLLLKFEIGVSLDLVIGTWNFGRRSNAKKNSCHSVGGHYLPHPMPKPIARSKTRKAVAKRFKITARGKVLRAQSSRRHLMASKRARRKRQLSKMARVDRTDEARVKANLPFA